MTRTSMEELRNDRVDLQLHEHDSKQNVLNLWLRLTFLKIHSNCSKNPYILENDP